MGLFNFETETVEKTTKRDALMINPEALSALNGLAAKSKAAGFDMFTNIEDDKLKFCFKNDLITIESNEFEIASPLEIPDGLAVSKSIEHVKKEFKLGEEVQKQQLETLKKGKALTVQSVQDIDKKVKDTFIAIESLCNRLTSQK